MGELKSYLFFELKDVFGGRRDEAVVCIGIVGPGVVVEEAQLGEGADGVRLRGRAHAAVHSVEHSL